MEGMVVMEVVSLEVVEDMVNLPKEVVILVVEEDIMVQVEMDLIVGEIQTGSIEVEVEGMEMVEVLNMEMLMDNLVVVADLDRPELEMVEMVFV